MSMTSQDLMFFFTFSLDPEQFLWNSSQCSPIVVRLFTDEDREKGGEQDEYKKGVIKEREKVKMERYREREKEEEQEEGK